MYLNSPSQVQQYFADPILANSKGHELISDVLISYFQSQICAAWSSAVGTAHELIPGPGPVVYNEKAKTPTDARGLFGGVAKKDMPPPLAMLLAKLGPKPLPLPLPEPEPPLLGVG